MNNFKIYIYKPYEKLQMFRFYVRPSSVNGGAMLLWRWVEG